MCVWTGRTRTKEAIWITEREHRPSFRKNLCTQNINTLTHENTSSNCKHTLVFINKIITRTASVAIRIFTRTQQMRRNVRTRFPQWILIIKKAENVTHVLRRLFFETRHRGTKYRMTKPWAPRRYTYGACTGERQETDIVFRKSLVWIQLLVIVKKYFEDSRVEIVPVLVWYR
jgi:hypothetical protein